ncbi:unnamed protein product, partial [Laminaria digitata]
LSTDHSKRFSAELAAERDLFIQIYLLRPPKSEPDVLAVNRLFLIRVRGASIIRRCIPRADFVFGCTHNRQTWPLLRLSLMPGALSKGPIIWCTDRPAPPPNIP